jgi:hypothetical protein
LFGDVMRKPLSSFVHLHCINSLAFVLTQVALLSAQQGAIAVPAQKPLPPDLALVPADTVQLVAFTLGQPWNGAEADSLKRVSSIHPVIPSYHLKDLPANLGVEAENVERMIQLSTPAEQTALVTTIKPYNREKVLAAFVPRAAEKSAGGKTYYHSDTSGNHLYFVDDRTLLLGMGQDLQGFLAREPADNRHDSLEFALRTIASGAPVVVHVGASGVRAFSADQQLAEGEFATLAKASAWHIVAEPDNGLTIRLLADFENAEDAANAKRELTVIGDKLSAIMPFFKQNMVPFLNNQEAQFPGASELAPKMSAAIDGATDALKQITVRSKDRHAGAQIVIATEEPLTTALLLLTLTPRAQAQPGH